MIALQSSRESYMVLSVSTVICVKFEQALRALCPINSTEAGIVMEAIFVYAKALNSILLSVDGRLIEFSPVSKNAPS